MYCFMHFLPRINLELCGMASFFSPYTPSDHPSRNFLGGTFFFLQLVAAAMMAFLFSLLTDSSGNSGKRPVEITWQDFTTLLLESGKVRYGDLIIFR